MRNKRNRAAIFLLTPFCLVFAGMVAVPIGYAIYQSLFKVERSGLGLEEPKKVFSGLENYSKALTDEAVREGIGRVLLFGIVQVPVMLGLALLLALLLDSASARFKRFFTLSFFLPYGIPGVLASVLWAYLYLPEFSPLSDLLHVNPLGPDSVLWSIANVVTWAWTGYNMLILYTALRAVPRELYEAASLDGASFFKIAWKIKVPLVRPAIALTGVFSIIGTLQLFNEPTVLRSITGNVSSTYTPAMTAYSAAFGGNDYNYAATIAVVLALTACVLSYTFLKLTSRGMGR